MPAHDRIMAETQVTAVHFDPTITKPPPGICHRLLPLVRTHGVAGEEPVDRT